MYNVLNKVYTPKYYHNIIKYSTYKLINTNKTTKYLNYYCTSNTKLYSKDELQSILIENQDKLGIKKHEDWYNVNDLNQLNYVIPVDALKQFKGSLYLLLSFVQPDFKWEPWKFNLNTSPSLSTVTPELANSPNPRGFWKDTSYQLLFMCWLAEQLGFTHTDYERWYSVGKSHFVKHRGRGLLNAFGDSVYTLLSSVYPDYDWLPWKFDNTPKGFWSSRDNQVRYIKWFASKLDIKQLKDWYRITKSDFQENYGSSLLLLYSGSPAKVIMTLVDPHDYSVDTPGWQIWRFTCLPRAAKLDIEVLKEFLKFAQQYYRIESQADWYRLSWSQIRDLGGFSIIKGNGGFCQSLAKVYPEMQWNPLLFNMPGKKSSQRLLKIFLDRLMSDYKVVEDYRNVELHRYRSTNTGFQLDFYIDELKLAFEYQGKQHFLDTPLFGDAKLYRDRDTEKRVICKELGIKIIDIPYWWDNQIESLIGTILENNGQPWISKYINQIHTQSDSQSQSIISNYKAIPSTYQKQRTHKKVHLL